MEKKIPKVCFIGASFETGNMGVSALTSGTLKAFYDRYPNGELFLLDYGEKGLTYKFQSGESIKIVKLVNIRFSKKLYLKNNIALLILFALFTRCIPFRDVTNKLISKNFCLRQITEADVVLSIAGGDSFSDIYGMRRLFYIALPQILVQILGKKYALLPQTIGPFKGKVAKVIAKTILRGAAIVYSRDYEGLKVTKDLIDSDTSDQRSRFCYDVGFIVDPVPPLEMDLDDLPEQDSRNSPLVGLNVSGLLFMGGYTKDNMFDLNVDYRALIYSIIEHLINKKGAYILLIPHVFGKHAESDSVACESIYSDLKKMYPNRLYLARGRYNQSEIKYIIGFCDLFIGSRMHACIAALSQNIPTVSIAYSKKFIGVMQTIRVSELVADPRKLGKEDILTVIDRGYDQRVSFKGHLEQTMPGVKRAVLDLFPEIIKAVTE